MSIREKFVERFGEKEAETIWQAACEHRNEVHDRQGSDPFRWAIAVCIGWECMSKEEYRKYHGITAPWDEVRQWIKDVAGLHKHDGDVDYVALFCGAYDEFMPEVTGERRTAGQ